MTGPAAGHSDFMDHCWPVLSKGLRRSNQCHGRIKFSKTWTSCSSEWNPNVSSPEQDGNLVFWLTHCLALGTGDSRGFEILAGRVHPGCCWHSAGRQTPSRAGLWAVCWRERKNTLKPSSGCCKWHRSAIWVAGVFFSAFSPPLLLTSSIFPAVFLGSQRLVAACQAEGCFKLYPVLLQE